MALDFDEVSRSRRTLEETKMGWDVGTKKVIRTNAVGRTGNDVWQQDKADNTKIIAARQDYHDQDLADAISACLNKNGVNTMAANLNMGGFDLTNLSASTILGMKAKDVASMSFDGGSGLLTITLNDASTVTATITGTGGGSTGTVESITIGDGLSSTANPITVSGTLSLETIGAAQTFSGGIESVSIDAHGRVTQVVTGASSSTNLGLGTRTASVMPITSSTGSGVNLPLVDKAQSYAGLMSPTDKTNLDNLVGSSGITEIIAGQAIQVTANSTERTVAALQGTTSQIGVLLLATTAEATTGTDTSKAVTPAGVKAVVDAIGSMSSDPAKWDFTNSGTSMYLRYEAGQLAEIPVASGGAYNGLLSSSDKTKLDGLPTPALVTTGTNCTLNGPSSATVRATIGASSTSHDHDSDYSVLGHGHSQYYESGDSPTFGTVSATSFNATSARHKKIEVHSGIQDRIWALNPIKYILIDDPEEKVRLGFYADEMEDHYPEAVAYDVNGDPAGIDYAALVVPLVAKIQELESRLEALEK